MYKSKSGNQVKSSRRGRRSRELEKTLKSLSKQEETVKRQLNLLECSIVAQPMLRQEQRLKNWNTLPAPDDFRRTRDASKLPRIRAQMIRQARTRQAIFALFLVIIMVGCAIWFCYQLRMHQLWD